MRRLTWNPLLLLFLTAAAIAGWDAETSKAGNAAATAAAGNSPDLAARLSESRRAIDATTPVAGNVNRDQEALADMAQCLIRATPESLAKPEICLARLFRLDGGVALILYWVAEDFDVDSVRLIWKGPQEYELDVRIDNLTRGGIIEDAAHSVLFPAVFRFPFEAKRPTPTAISVALLRNGKVVSNVFRVDQTYLQEANDGVSSGAGAPTGSAGGSGS